MYPLSARFPPYTDHRKKLMTFLLKLGGITYTQIGKTLTAVAIAACGVAILKIKPNL